MPDSKSLPEGFEYRNFLKVNGFINRMYRYSHEEMVDLRKKYGIILHSNTVTYPVNELVPVELAPKQMLDQANKENLTYEIPNTDGKQRGYLIEKVVRAVRCADYAILNPVKGDIVNKKFTGQIMLDEISVGLSAGQMSTGIEVGAPDPIMVTAKNSIQEVTAAKDSDDSAKKLKVRKDK